MDWGSFGGFVWSLLGCLVPMAILVVMIVTIVRRGTAITKLVHHGADAEAIVIKKFRTSGGSGSGVPYLRYEFHDPFGKSYQRKVAVSEEEHERYEVGDTIEICVLPDKPEVNATRAMVELSRSALRTKRDTP